jgi:hypothetical protein
MLRCRVMLWVSFATETTNPMTARSATTCLLLIVVDCFAHVCSNRFFMPGHGSEKMLWFSWNLGSVHFISYSSEVLPHVWLC